MRCTVVFYTDSCCSSLCHRVKKNNTLRLCLHYYSNTLIELKDCSPRCSPLYGIGKEVGSLAGRSGVAGG